MQIYTAYHSYLSFSSTIPIQSTYANHQPNFYLTARHLPKPSTMSTNWRCNQNCPVPAHGGRIFNKTNMDSGNKNQAVCIMAGSHYQSGCQAPPGEQRDNEGTWAKRAERTTVHKNQRTHQQANSRNQQQQYAGTPKPQKIRCIHQSIFG